jgi:hypothetical protein
MIRQMTTAFWIKRKCWRGSNKLPCYVHGHNKTFRVPHSCRATERNGNSINADVTDDANEND